MIEKIRQTLRIPHLNVKQNKYMDLKAITIQYTENDKLSKVALPNRNTMPAKNTNHICSSSNFGICLCVYS